MRTKPFATRAELDAYIAGDAIECLECGRFFKSLATHIPRIHAMTHDEYRDKWAIPKGTPLAGQATREILSAQMRESIETGTINHEHLPTATKIAKRAERPAKQPADADAHRALIRNLRPGDHSRLPPRAKRADGRDADRARQYQREYRAKHK